MKDIIEVKNQIKNKLDRDTVSSILIFIGIEITKNYRFKDNPSFSIREDGIIHDFGSTSFHGDVFSLIMQYKNVSFIESLKFVAN